MAPTTTPDIGIVRDPASALVLLHSERRRLVEALAVQPDSAAGLARRLNEKRQRLNYHLRLLEDAGIIELAEGRQAGSRTERVLRVVARRFVLDPLVAGPLGRVEPAGTGDRFSATYLVAVAARAIRELSELMRRAVVRRSRLATAALNTSVRLRSPAQFGVFIDELTEAVAQVVARHHHEGGDGRWYRVVAGVYPGPDPARTGKEASDG
jgi:DNA-binding transcriptional ArsR family regulator